MVGQCSQVDALGQTGRECEQLAPKLYRKWHKKSVHRRHGNLARRQRCEGQHRARPRLLVVPRGCHRYDCSHNELLLAACVNNVERAGKRLGVWLSQGARLDDEVGHASVYVRAILGDPRGARPRYALGRLRRLDDHSAVLHVPRAPVQIGDALGTDFYHVSDRADDDGLCCLLAGGGSQQK